MSKKVEVPQELLDQIIDCYVNQQLSLEKTIIKLKLPFGRNPLKRILTENGIHIRTYKEAANIGIRQPIPQDMQKIIVDLYQKVFSIERIQKELTVFFSSDKIRKTLQENNIQLRTLEEAKKVQIDFEERKYPVDDDYLLESHNGAWLLGFIASDGYLPITKGAKNRIVISLARKDEDVLKLIAKELKYEGPIYQYTASDGKSLISTLAFSSKKIRRQLEENTVLLIIRLLKSMNFHLIYRMNICQIIFEDILMEMEAYLNCGINALICQLLVRIKIFLNLFNNIYNDMIYHQEQFQIIMHLI